MDQRLSVHEGKRSPAVDKYLKAIYLLHQEHAQVTTSLLAKQLSVKPASVSGMIHKLAKLNLVTHIPYRGVALTNVGRRAASEVLCLHHLLERFLVEALHYSWDEAYVEAEVLGHAVSATLASRMRTYLERQRVCGAYNLQVSGAGCSAKISGRNLTI